MTHAGMFEESQLHDKMKKLKAEMKVLKAETKRETPNLERIIETQAKEIDTLKTIIEIDRYTEKQLKERKQNEIRKKELE